MSQPPPFPGPSDPQQPQQSGAPQPQPSEGQQWQLARAQNSQGGAGKYRATPQQGQQGGLDGQSGNVGRGKGPILVTVGCGLLILVLVLALVGFFGVRALMGDDDSADQPSAAQEESPAEEETTEEERAEPEPTEEEVAAGEENAVPQGTVVTLPELEGFEGSLDISIGEVNRDAADWVDEQNSHNPKPIDQGTCIMVKAEVGGF